MPAQSSKPAHAHSDSIDAIRIRGARQNNLRHVDIDFPLNQLTVVTGVSGSGKSSLVFDTLYAEGQRRYVETFSAYARQFLDRMDRPQVDAIEGIPPAIAIDQANPVRTSRSTVGTMTELNDHLKLLFARLATLHCRQCAQAVEKDDAPRIARWLETAAPANPQTRFLLTFQVKKPDSVSEAELENWLAAQGYTRTHAAAAATAPGTVTVVQDRFKGSGWDAGRANEGIEAALKSGKGQMAIYQIDEAGLESVRRFSSEFHCAPCDIRYHPPRPALFSFNSPIGACETCRGFGRVIGIDLNLVIPDERKTLRHNAIRPFQSESFKECQADLIRLAPQFDVPLDTPYRDLTEAQKRWVYEGQADFSGDWKNQWYGIRGFFNWMESRAYKMHVRVMLSRYRSYGVCEACNGARLKPDALLWRVDGLSIHEIMQRPIGELASWFAAIAPETQTSAFDEATALVVGEIRSRLNFLVETGLSYLTLDRQSRTLSGGEVQRINLTTALGTSLVNTLFVLDEPSVGLHPRDVGRIGAVMRRLVDAGNTLVVVEHDPQLMLDADRIVDVGPGPGEKGGRVVFEGPVRDLLASDTLTGDYLAGHKQVSAHFTRRSVAPDHPCLRLLGARENNLQNIDVDFPLGRLIAVSGVSGSGKSTLIEDVLYPAVAKALGQSLDANTVLGAFSRLEGAETFSEITLVDQGAIGKTTRSNPAVYVGAFDAIRTRFANAPLAKQRGYTAGTFSFNAGDGRCPVCGGNGFEHVEMQFLSDVYLRCSECDGTRYRAEILDVTLEKASGGDQATALSIAQVLELTVTQALDWFACDPEIARRLKPLVDVGLDYLRLGQPVPTLSGGEAQRLKLASFLANIPGVDAIPQAKRAARPAAARQPQLFLFDEPTTGLHFDDIAKLLVALHRLVDAGHTVIVIEHQLDVIRAADWVIDLGPEGGVGGGRVVATGTPERLSTLPESSTGRALNEESEHLLRLRQPQAREASAPYSKDPVDANAPAAVDEGHGIPLQTRLRQRARNAIVVHDAREHNLKNLSVEIPRQKMTVLSGPSGSGKSTLAFDIVFAEGQRRYLESLNAYARQFVQPAARPDVDAVMGIPPTVAIAQRTSRGGRKSTVGTVTEIHHFLRLLFVKLGVQYCPDDGTPIQPQTFDAMVATLLREHRQQNLALFAPLVVARKGIYQELAKWAHARGFSQLRVDGAMLPTEPFPRIDRYKEHHIELPVGTLTIDLDDEVSLRALLKTALEYGHGVVLLINEQGASRLLSTQRACPTCARSFPEPDPRLFSYNSRHGWCPACLGTGVKLAGDLSKLSGENPDARDKGQTLDLGGEDRAWMDADTGETCPVCAGGRLNPSALAVQFQGQSIADVSRLSVSALRQNFSERPLTGREAEIGRDAQEEIISRLAFLEEVGLGYLTLDRSAPTLSGGEAQRIRLAAQLGSNLQGVAYVLDEPTIGLHPRDNRALLRLLTQLRDRGNTLLIVEHDEDTLRCADHLIDIGPGAGRLGGSIVAEGSPQALAQHAESATGRLLARAPSLPSAPRRPVNPDSPRLTIERATLHNLRDLSVHIPLERLVVITGVSGSGKSTLARGVLLEELGPALAPRAGQSSSPWQHCTGMQGFGGIARVLEVDQTPIGKTPRSCPATYIGFWDTIRKLFADTQTARERGWGPARFSFNAGEGRCPSCDGAGEQTVEMSFLPDVRVPCDDCGGLRFNPDTLTATLRGKSIGEVLAMSVDDAVEFFGASPALTRPLKLLQDVGLGYLTLGQPSPTLSGGEAQRIKLVTELSKARLDGDGKRRMHPKGDGQTLYVLDEPSVGLHASDVEKLLAVLHRLVDAGHSVVVIEHDADIWAQADWIIDMGPEGGAAGGLVVAEGSPQALAAQPERSWTCRVLAERQTV